MKTYALHLRASFIDPFWLRSVAAKRHTTVVRPDGLVEFEGELLSFRGDCLPPGTEIQVSLGHDFWCVALADLAAERQAQAAAATAKAEADRLRLNKLRDAAIETNAGISLPVRWEPGQKDVLSGLSERSWGDGRNKATVNHIHLLEPLQAGRLVRRADDFLCTAASGSNGKRWSAVTVSSVDGDGNPYAPAITCKACLKLAKAWTTGTHHA